MIFKNEVGLCFPCGRLSVIHHNLEVKALYIAQAGYQLSMFIKQFPENALATTVFPNALATTVFPKLSPAFCHLAYPPTKRNISTLS